MVALYLLADFLALIIPNIAQGISTIWNNVKGWGENLKNFITNLVNNIRNGINNFIDNTKNAFVNGFNTIRNNVNNIISKVQELVSGMLNKIRELPERVVSIGRDLVSGIWSGISDRIGWVQDRIAGMGSAITNAIKGVFGIASPSKVWAKEVGAMLPPGLYNGFEDSMEDVQADIMEDMNKLTASVSGDVQAYGTAGAAMYDSGETINSGGNTINIYAAEGQSVEAIAEAVAYKLEEMTTRRGAVYA